VEAEIGGSSFFSAAAARVDEFTFRHERSTPTTRTKQEPQHGETGKVKTWVPNM